VQALLQTASKSMYKRHILLSAPNPVLGNGSFAEVPAILLTINGTKMNCRKMEKLGRYIKVSSLLYSVTTVVSERSACKCCTPKTSPEI
jgi:hypothetical protein